LSDVLAGSAATLHLGELWHAPPAAPGEEPELEVWAEGGLAVDAAGRIIAIGEAAAVRAMYPTAEVVDHGDAVLVPGLIDAHVHAPQLDMIGAHGASLLGWLAAHTYPAEMRYADVAYARASAAAFTTELLANGTTCAFAYATVHEHGARAVLAAGEASGLRLVVGKVSMDQGAPAPLTQPEAEDRAALERLFAAWDGRDGRLGVAITPRFALSCSPAQLRALGALARARPQAYVQTHYAESDAEIAAVRKAFPEARDYLAVYEAAGLVGERTLLAHGVHVSDDELARLARARAVVVHCPTSNLFLGSGLFPLDRYRRAGVPLALGSDVGAGTSLSLWRTMAAAADVQAMRGASVSPVLLFALATTLGAEALGLGARLGHFGPGLAADFVVLDWRRSRLLTRRFAQETTAVGRLAAVVALADDRLTKAVYVQGRALAVDGGGNA
jgi:guanine deaminase